SGRRRASAERRRQNQRCGQPAALPARRRGDPGGSVRAPDRPAEERLGWRGEPKGARMDNPLIQPDPGLYIWTIVTFLVLLGLLAKYAWRPLLEALEKRQESIRKSLDDAQQAKVELERLQ